MMDKQEYEERYGEKVIYCKIHNMSGIDGCVVCDDEDKDLYILNTPKEEWVSECCGSKSILELDISEFGVTGFCGHCHDAVGFEPPW